MNSPTDGLSLQQLQLIFESLADGILVSDPHGEVLYANRSAEAIFGRSSLAGRNLGIAVSPDQAATELRLLRAAGLGWAELRTARIEWEGRPAILASILDITERKQAEEQLRLAATALQSAGEGITITDLAGNILSINRAFTTLTGYTFEEVRGKNPRLLKSGLHDAGFYQSMWTSINDNGYWSGEIWNRRKNGETYPEWLGISSVRDRDGRPTHYIGVFSDISERKAAEARIQFLAWHDALTELPNRLLLIDRAEQAFAHARHTHQHCALLTCDLDNFKSINDSLGHRVGDALLVAVRERIKCCLAEGDTLSRQGGDEFQCLLADRANSDAIAADAARIIEQMARAFRVEDYDLSLSASIGIAIYPDDGDNFDTLMKNADTALYQAKAGGRNAYRFFTEKMNAGAMERLRLRSDLSRALREGEFRLHYQPQIDLRTGCLNGMEALIRWQHPQRGLLSPAQFIDLAEENGMIVPIGEWVLREACHQTARWAAEGMDQLRVAVNLSVIQLQRGNLEAVVAEALADSGLPPGMLELEVTESILIDDVEAAVAFLSRMKALGISIAIDDFGTGYSSLAYLKRLRVDKLKIDQSFIRCMEEDPESAAIVRAIIQMAQALNLSTIAEGLETPGLPARLREEGCDEAQGYLYAKPLPPEEFPLLARSLVISARVLPG